MGRKVIEEVIPISNIDPVTCREKLKGDINEHGFCLVRIRQDVGNPEKAELLRMIYLNRRMPQPEPVRSESL